VVILSTSFEKTYSFFEMRESPQASLVHYGQPIAFSEGRAIDANVLNGSPVSHGYPNVVQSGYSDQLYKGQPGSNRLSFNSSHAVQTNKMLEDVQSITSQNSAVVYQGYPDLEQVRKIEAIHRQEIVNSSRDLLLSSSRTKSKRYVLPDNQEVNVSKSPVGSRLSRFRRLLDIQVKFMMIGLGLLLLIIVVLLVYVLTSVP